MFDSVNNFEMNSSIDGNNNIIENEMNVDIDMIQNGQMGQAINGGCCNTITETPQERCIHRTFVHEVPQDCFFMIEKMEKYKYKI